MELSLFQGCATPPVHFFPPYVQPTFTLLQVSAVASWSFHRWLHPFSSQTSGGEGQQLSSPFACSVCAAQIGITTLVGLWYQLLPPHPQVILHLRHPKEPSDSGMHQKLPGLKILGSTFLFLTPRAFGYQNVGLCHLCCVIRRVLQSLGYWILHLGPLHCFP